MDLDGGGTDTLGHFRREQLRHRGFLEARATGVAQRRRVPDHLPSDLNVYRHVRELEADRLMFGNDLSKTFPIAGKRQCGIESSARHADRLRRNADATTLEIGQCDAVTATFGAKQIRRRHFTILEHDLRGIRCVLAQLFLDPRHDKAWCSRIDDETGDALFAGALVGDSEHDRHIGILAGSDELLDAIEHIPIAALLGARGDGAGIRSRLRLGQTETAERFATRERLQEVFFLRVGAECIEWSAHHGVLDADNGRRRAIACCDFLQRNGERHVVHRGAAPLFGHDHAHRAKLTQCPQLLAREMRLAIPARGVRRELLLRKRTHGVANQLLFFVQQHCVMSSQWPLALPTD